MAPSPASPPGSERDLQDPQVVCQLLDRAARANLEHPLRKGSVYELPKFETPGQGRLTLTGDLHDNANNFLRIIKLAQLDASPDHYVVLHELVHGPALVNGVDMSVVTIARVAALKAQYPDQVLLIQSNHDLAQYRGEGILKAGVSVTEAFDLGVDFIYGADAEDVRQAAQRFIRSFGLAVRCGNGVMCAHSLPAPRKIDTFDPTVLDREPTDDDLDAPNGSAYLMVWGRHHTQKIAEELCEKLGAEQFVLGHQPAEMGYRSEGDRILIINSDHSHGVALPIDLAESYDQEDLIESIRPLNAVRL